MQLITTDLVRRQSAYKKIHPSLICTTNIRCKWAGGAGGADTVVSVSRSYETAGSFFFIRVS